MLEFIFTFRFVAADTCGWALKKDERAYSGISSYTPSQISISYYFVAAMKVSN